MTAGGEEYDLLNRVPAGYSSEPDAALARQELGLRIQRALQTLTPRERVIFELKHYHGLKLRTIGAIISTSEQAVKTSLFRATRKMRAGLADMRAAALARHEPVAATSARVQGEGQILATTHS